ncbi:MAG: hypothetical protein ABI426_00800 [Flavobacterium sp.]
MKKGTFYLGLAAALFIFSCGKKEEKTTETVETNTVEKVETVEVPVPADTVVKEGTAVKVSGDGVSVDSKNVDVEVKK